MSIQKQEPEQKEELSILIVVVPRGYSFYQIDIENRLQETWCYSHRVAEATGYPYEKDFLVITHNVNPFAILQIYRERTGENVQTLGLVNPLGINLG